MKKDLIDLTELSKEELIEILDLADNIKRNPSNYSNKLNRKTLLMIFDKASLRTRVSFEVGLTKMGGHAIYYDVSTSPLGRKETMSDTAKTSSRFVDIIMARIGNHEDIQDLALNSDVPVINAMTNMAHPCQILADLQTIREKKGKLKGLKLAWVGVGDNNVTNSMIIGCALSGINIFVASPESDMPQNNIIKTAKAIADDSVIKVTNNPIEAVENADVVVTDSWMSYHIPKEEIESRKKIYMPYQVNSELMSHAKEDAIFMNCLPAMRGMEQTAEVVDGPQSVVFDEAENRLHAQNALMLKLLDLD